MTDSGEPWWMTALRVLFVFGMLSGAWTGYKAQKAAKAKKKADEAVAAAASTPAPPSQRPLDGL